MWIFNITFHPDAAARDELLTYLREQLIPALMAGGLLRRPGLMEIRLDPAPGYALQFQLDSETALREFLQSYWPAHQQSLTERFGESVPFFVTRMKKIPLE